MVIQYSELFMVDEHNDGRRYGMVFAVRPPSTERMRDALRARYDTRVPPDELLVLCAATYREELLASCNPDSLAVAEVTRHVDTPGIQPLTFDAGGNVRAEGEVEGGHLSRAINSVIARGQREIFRARGGMLDSRGGFHYGKPSGAHSERFLRAGNVLLYDAEVAFIAFRLLGFLRAGDERIYTDTASINSLGLMLLRLRDLFAVSAGQEVATTLVESFSSYWGLPEPLEFADRSLCLISASTSGRLAARIHSTFGIPNDRIVTAYYCGLPVEGQRILCDLTVPGGASAPRDTDATADESGYWPAVPSYSDKECPLCRRGSRLVHITGDVFFPEDPILEPLMFTVSDVPAWIAPLMSDFIALRAVFAHRGLSGTSRQVRQLYLDLEPLLRYADDTGATQIGGEFSRALQRSMPAATAAILHLDDPTSVAMARLASEHMNSVAANRQPLVISERDLNDECFQEAATGPIVVVASTSVTGRSLLRLSQALREAAADRPLIYMVLLARSGDRNTWAETRSNLTFGARGPGDNEVIAVRRAQLPDDTSYGMSPWTREYQFLGEVIDWVDVSGAHAPAMRDVLQARRDVLDPSESDSGLQQNLFWPPAGEDDYMLQGDALALTSGFAFWRSVDYDYRDASQADVFMTVAAILHTKRGAGGLRSGLYHLHHARPVISPSNFHRFNDGVLQAAFLRAALPAELDFSTESRLSGQMYEILMHFLGRLDRRAGEALPEFVLAVAMGKLKLARTHAKQFMAEVEDRLGGVLAVLAEYWREGQEGSFA